MKKNIFLFAAAFTLMVTALTPLHAAPEPGAVCPVSGDTLKNNKVSLEYQGKNYSFCCKGCLRKFKKNPVKYLAENQPS